MARRSFTDGEKEAAVAVFAEHGQAEASRLLGIPKSTLGSWAKKAGVRSVADKKTEAATESIRIQREKRMEELADAMLAEAAQTVVDMHSPIVVATMAGAV